MSPVLCMASERADLTGRRTFSICGRCLQAPFLGIVLFGVYLLATLAHGVSNFKDKPQEAASLQQVCIKQASCHMFPRICHPDNAAHLLTLHSTVSWHYQRSRQVYMHIVSRAMSMLDAGHSLGARRTGKAGRHRTRSSA